MACVPLSAHVNASCCKVALSSRESTAGLGGVERYFLEELIEGAFLINSDVGAHAASSGGGCMPQILLQGIGTVPACK